MRLKVFDESSQLTEPASLLPLLRVQCERLLAVGDPMQLAGAFAVHGDRIVAGTAAEHAGSPVDLQTLAAALDAVRASE